MSDSPVANEPGWSLVRDRYPSTFTRPLLGSERGFDKMHIDFNGLTEVCMGITFTTTLNVHELVSRAKNAFATLRYLIPVVAASIEGDPPAERSWVYEPVLGSNQARSWLDDTFQVQQGPFDAEEFCRSMNQKRLPCVSPTGRNIYFICYLLIGPVDTHAIFFHGTHAMMEAKPTLKAFDTLLNAIAFPQYEDLEDLDWGSEWCRLPAGPVEATGGPRKDWHKGGTALLDDIRNLIRHPVIPTSLHPPRNNICVAGKSHRLRVSFEQSSTSRLVKSLRTVGHTVGHLVDAAVAMALFAHHPPSAEEAADAHVLFDLAMMSQEKFQQRAYTGDSQFVVGLVFVPVQIPYTAIAENCKPRDKLLAAMAVIKTQYDRYLANPHLPHLSTAQINLSHPYPPTHDASPCAVSPTNFGVVEKYMHMQYGAEVDGQGTSIITVQDLTVGHRATFLRPMVHVWTINGTLQIQVQASDAWDEPLLEAFLAEVRKQIFYMLDDHSLEPDRHSERESTENSRSTNLVA